MTAKQKLFVDFYLGDAKLNAAKAARLAGYSRKRARIEGSELLARADVRAAIDARLEVAALTAKEAMFLLSEHARGTVEPFLYDDYEDDELAPRGRLKLDTEAARENVHLLREVTQIETDLGEGKKKTTTRIKLHDPQAALVQILRARGAFKDDGDLLRDLDLGRLSIRQLELLAAGEDPRRVLMLPSGEDGLDVIEGIVEDDLPPARPPAALAAATPQNETEN